jgi:predicted nicotinamide N-methyase
VDGGRTIVEKIAPGGVELELERPAAPDELLDEERFADDEFLPYWAELWPSGVALAEHVAGRALAGLDVLELGCGLGVPSLVAAARGGRVVATDWAPEALVLLEANAERNRVALGTLHLDWRQPALLAGRRFDVVLAADVLYEARNVEPLLDVLPQVLRPGGEVLLADPGRGHAERFLDDARLGDAQVRTEPHGLLPRGGIHRCRCPRRGDELMRS